MIRIVLPWDVLAQVNHRLVKRHGGAGLVLSADYRAKKQAAGTLVAVQVKGARPRYRVPVRVALRFYEPDQRRRDPSNLLKLIEDCMAGTVYDDDSRIVALSWERCGVDRKRPRVEVTVEPVDGERAA